jgi:hypothetical protein
MWRHWQASKSSDHRFIEPTQRSFCASWVFLSSPVGTKKAEPTAGAHPAPKQGCLLVGFDLNCPHRDATSLRHCSRFSGAGAQSCPRPAQTRRLIRRGVEPGAGSVPKPAQPARNQVTLRLPSRVASTGWFRVGRVRVCRMPETRFALGITRSKGCGPRSLPCARVTSLYQLRDASLRWTRVFPGLNNLNLLRSNP